MPWGTFALLTLLSSSAGMAFPATPAQGSTSRHDVGALATSRQHTAIAPTTVLSRPCRSKFGEDVNDGVVGFSNRRASAGPLSVLGCGFPYLATARSRRKAITVKLVKIQSYPRTVGAARPRPLPIKPKLRCASVEDSCCMVPSFGSYRRSTAFALGSGTNDSLQTLLTPPRAPRGTPRAPPSPSTARSPRPSACPLPASPACAARGSRSA